MYNAVRNIPSFGTEPLFFFSLFLPHNFPLLTWLSGSKGKAQSRFQARWILCEGISRQGEGGDPPEAGSPCCWWLLCPCTGQGLLCRPYPWVRIAVVVQGFLSLTVEIVSTKLHQNPARSSNSSDCFKSTTVSSSRSPRLLSKCSVSLSLMLHMGSSSQIIALSRTDGAIHVASPTWSPSANLSTSAVTAKSTSNASPLPTTVSSKRLLASTISSRWRILSTKSSLLAPTSNK